LMSIPQALFLGIVQGLTEFLPISSSGHLVLFQHYLGLTEPMVFFDVLLHAGTLAAVVIFFRKELYLILLSLIKPSSGGNFSSQRQILLAVILGTIPTGIIGFFLEKIKDFLFQGVFISAAMLVLTGILLWMGETLSPSQKKSKIGISDALLIGLMQGLAIIPGISRSGATISFGLIRGLGRRLSFQYSFFLFIPAVLGALIMESREIALQPATGAFPYVIGPIVAFAAGLVALRVLKKILQEKKLVAFSYYCWVLGGGVLFMEAVKIIIKVA